MFKVTFDDVAALLKDEAKKRNCLDELCFEKPDPLMVAKAYKDEYISLICALFAYGNASLIVKFLQSLDFSFLQKDEDEIRKALKNHYYRFQNSEDVIAFFITLSRLKKEEIGLESLFCEGYSKSKNVMDGIRVVLERLYAINTYRSQGYQFLLGAIPAANPTSPYKRWHMYLRWMVRNDHLDMGLWGGVEKKDLLVPLDTHTFSVGKKLGLIKRKSYDFKAVLELSEAFAKIDANDPIQYDFALYRLGQEKIVI